MFVRAYAKINLTLDVLDKRPDGYHNISSVMQTINLDDSLSVELTPHPGKVELNLGCCIAEDPLDRPPEDHTNLAHKAAIELLRRSGSDAGVRIGLWKNVPSQAGLGGGSSDAAATLKALNELLGWPLTPGELSSLAAEIGADVPFFLYGGTCLVQGTGDRVTRLAPLPPFTALLVKPPCGVSTAEAYRAIDETRGGVEKIEAGKWAGDLHSLHNDFESVVFRQYPQIAGVRQVLTDAGWDPVHLCGSGSALYAFLPESVWPLEQRLSPEYKAQAAAMSSKLKDLGVLWSRSVVSLAAGECI